MSRASSESDHKMSIVYTAVLNELNAVGFTNFDRILDDRVIDAMRRSCPELSNDANPEEVLAAAVNSILENGSNQELANLYKIVSTMQHSFGGRKDEIFFKEILQEDKYIFCKGILESTNCSLDMLIKTLFRTFMFQDLDLKRYLTLCPMKCEKSNRKRELADYCLHLLAGGLMP